MTAQIIEIRDYKRPEEKAAEIRRLADNLVELGDRIRAARQDDTAPSEMPPVQPMYVAPERDGA